MLFFHFLSNFSWWEVQEGAKKFLNLRKFRKLRKFHMLRNFACYKNFTEVIIVQCSCFIIFLFYYIYKYIYIYIYISKKIWYLKIYIKKKKFRTQISQAAKFLHFSQSNFVLIITFSSELCFRRFWYCWKA